MVIFPFLILCLLIEASILYLYSGCFLKGTELFGSAIVIS